MDAPGLLVHHPRGCEIAAGTRDERQAVESGGDTKLVANLAAQCQTLSAQPRGPRVMPLVMRQDARASQRPRASGDVVGSIRWRGLDIIRHPQRLLQPSTAFGQVAARIPEMPHGGAQTQSGVRVVLLHRPTQ